jgi:hypothetical protein
MQYVNVIPVEREAGPRADHTYWLLAWCCDICSVASSMRMQPTKRTNVESFAFQAGSWGRTLSIDRWVTKSTNQDHDAPLNKRLVIRYLCMCVTWRTLALFLCHRGQVVASIQKTVQSTKHLPKTTSTDSVPPLDRWADRLPKTQLIAGEFWTRQLFSSIIMYQHLARRSFWDFGKVTVDKIDSWCSLRFAKLPWDFAQAPLGFWRSYR